MSLRPKQSIPPVPDDTVRLARAAFRRGNPYVLLRDRLGAVFDDAGFTDLYPKLGQPAYAPWRLALITLMQFREGLSDRQAADAVRDRIDKEYLLALDLADAASTFLSCASSVAGCSSTRPAGVCWTACWTPRARTAC